MRLVPPSYRSVSRRLLAALLGSAAALLAGVALCGAHASGMSVHTAGDGTAFTDSLVSAPAGNEPDSGRARKRHDWITFDLMLGVQQLSREWLPYEQNAHIGISSQARYWDAPLWVDGSIVVAWAGQTDAEGHRAGPGMSAVELHNGIGTEWLIRATSSAAFVGGGISYVWGSLTLPDSSRPIPGFDEIFGHPVYHDMDESATFWGGYLRAGLLQRVSSLWHVGVCFQWTMTSRQTVLGRVLSMDGALMSVFIGIGE